MFENVEKKFNKAMKDLGMEWAAKTDKEKFEELMKKGEMEKLEKPVVYIAKCPVWENPNVGPRILTFKSKKERDEWYEKEGEYLENAFGIEIEMPEDPVPDEGFDK